MTLIKTTAIYGLGALGMLYGSMLQKTYGPENVRFVMDSSRYARQKWTYLRAPSSLWD